MSKTQVTLCLQHDNPYEHLTSETHLTILSWRNFIALFLIDGLQVLIYRKTAHLSGMGLEIERKYLVVGDAWRENAQTELFVQGYILSEKDRVVRIRLEGEKAKLTIKQELSSRVRNEYEYDIPTEDAHEMLDNLCTKPLIKKNRHFLVFENHDWIIDEFMDDNEGLIVAELELDDAEQSFPNPPWLGEEVTEDKRYYNAVLSQFPYKQWTDKH